MWWRGGFLVAVTWLAVATTDQPESKHRLPGLVVPHHYDLRVLVDIDPATNFTYYGIVRISVKCHEDTDEIVLHSKKHSIKETALVLGENEEYKVTEGLVDERLDFLTLKLDRSLTAGENYTVVVPFHGTLLQDMAGMYVSKYSNKSTGQQEWLATTQFEPDHARGAFPCFDEPALKATFKVTLGHDPGYKAISNMPRLCTAVDISREDDWLWDEMSRMTKKDISDMAWDSFKTSVPMSTYLLAFVVSKFPYVESPSSLSNVRFRVWARGDAINQTKYASTIGPRMLSFYEQFFDVPYPLTKMDMIAIPDFLTSGMENWGLITYSEPYLLFDEHEPFEQAKELVATVVAHELAHQWFGNLVTMKWWSDLWLNEGFATYVGSMGVHAVEPSWDTNTKTTIFESVMSMNSWASAQPLSAPINDPKLIPQMFNPSTYMKGASLIRMMNRFLGEDVFKSGIKSYLTRHSYGAVEQDDLWRALTEAAAASSDALPAGATLKQVMDTWTRQAGHPLLTVQRDYDNGTVTVKQTRDLALGSVANSSASWWVPLTILPQGDPSERPPIVWLSDCEGTEQARTLQHAADSDQWLLFNADMIAPYRVNYDHRNWAMLSSTLNSDDYQSIPMPGRVQLLIDALELAWNDLLDYDTALGIIKYLPRETHVLPLTIGLAALKRIEFLLMRTADYEGFLKFAMKLLTPPKNRRAGVTSDWGLSASERLDQEKMEVLIHETKCRMGDQSCKIQSNEMFDKWMQEKDPDTTNPIPVPMRMSVYCEAVSSGTARQWSFLFKRYQNSNIALAKQIMLAALTCTNEIWLLKRYLEWMVDGGHNIRTHQAANIMALIAKNPVGYYVARPFFYTRTADIQRALFGHRWQIVVIATALLSQFTTQEELDEFFAWHERNPQYLEGMIAVEQAVEEAISNIAWLRRNQATVPKLMRKLARTMGPTRL